jgi:lipooligosaccharide transport system permease protein
VTATLALRVMERNARLANRSRLMFLAGFAEPLLYLLSIGLGVGGLVGNVTTGDVTVPYDVFVAPGLMAASTMNAAVFDTVFNLFIKWKYMKTYDAVLATPVSVDDVVLGEVGWTLLRIGVYGTGFLATAAALGLVRSWWAVLAVPAALLAAWGFAGPSALAATYIRSFVDFDFVNMVIVPLFLFSATFFPLERYPEGIAVVVQALPLYQAVALLRGLFLGDVGWIMLLHVAYLGGLGTVTMTVGRRRLARRLQP